MFCKTNVLNIFAKFTGKHSCWSLVFRRSFAALLKWLQYQFFPVNFAKYLRTFSYRIPSDECFWELKLIYMNFVATTGSSGRGVSRSCTICAPKLDWKKDIQNLKSLLFLSYDLMSCEAFTQLGVNNKQQFFFLF